MDDALHRRSNIFSKLPIFCRTKYAPLDADTQPQPLLGDVRPSLYINPNAVLEEGADPFANSLGQALSQTRHDVADPIVSHKLEAGHREDAQHLARSDI